MSISKIIFNIDSLRIIYKEDGIKGIKKSFNKIDSFFIFDEMSSKVFELINNNKIEEATKILENEW